MRNIFFIIILLSLPSCYLSEELPPDQEIWNYALPSEVGLNDSLLYQLDNSIQNTQYGNIDGLIIIKDNNLVFENYYNDFYRARTNTIGRGSMAVTALMLNFFLEEGLIADINDPIYQYLPDYQRIFDATPQKQEITILHLLLNTSGLVWNESVINTQQNTSDIQKMKLTDDWVEYILSKSMEATPGLRKVVNSASGIILARIFQNQLGEDELEDYINEKLFSPMGIKNYQWETDSTGTLNGGNGLSISTLDYTKIGYLIAQEGKWTENKRIVNRDWALDVITPWISYDTDYGFGYGWWIFTDNFLETYLSNIATLPFISGESGSSLFLIPEQEMVVCIHANNYYFNSIYTPSLEILLKSVESLETSSIN